MTISSRMIGSRSTAPASWTALRRASEAAKRKARSLESTSWVAPSTRVTFRSTSGIAGPAAGLGLLAQAGLDRRQELGRDHAPLELVDEVQHGRSLGLGLRLEVDRDLGIEPRAAGLADAASLDLS